MKNEKGFTLIELVVSIAVLSVLIVPFFGIFTNAAKLDMRSNKDLTANYLAQQLASEAKENSTDHSTYWTDSGWTETASGSGVFTKSSLGGDYAEYSAIMTYAPQNLSISSNGLEGTISGDIKDYKVIFDIIWDAEEKTLSYILDDGTIVEGEAETDTSNDFEIFLENDDDGGMDDFIIRFKINSHKEVIYSFTLPRLMTSVSINTIAIPGPTLDKERKLTINNTTEDVDPKPKKNEPGSREISLEVDAALDKEIFDVKFGKGVVLTYLDEEEEVIIQEEKDLLFLTVEVSGYDPIGKEIRVLKTLKTAVLED